MSKTLRTVVVVAVTAFLFTGCNQAASQPGTANTAAPAGGAPKIDFEKYTLPNGLDVILSEDHRLPLVAVNLWYHVGPGERGGRAHRLRAPLRAHDVPGLEARARRPALQDRSKAPAAATSTARPTSIARTTSRRCRRTSSSSALWLESDRMGYLLDTLDQAKLANQQDVVRNERRQSVENQPYGIVEEALFHQLFPKAHPYYADVIGSHADIQAAKLDDVKNFFKQYYAPNNASLVDRRRHRQGRDARRWSRSTSARSSGAPTCPKPAVETPTITAERRAVVKDRVELPRVYMAWITSPIFKPGDADADIAASVLGGGKSSRLYKTLVYEKQIAQDVSAQQQSLMLGSVFQIEATARPGHTAEELEKAIDEELDEASRRPGRTQPEVERARNVIETRIVEGLETLGGFGGVADRLNIYNHYLGDPGYLAEDIQRYRDVTPASVKAFAQRAARSRRRASSCTACRAAGPGPAGADAAGAEGRAGRRRRSRSTPTRRGASDAPKPGQAGAAAAAGADVVPARERPDGASQRAPGAAGRVGEPRRQDRQRRESDRTSPGSRTSPRRCSTRAPTSRSALQIADEVAQLGASLSDDVDDGRVAASTASSLQRNFPAAARAAGRRRAPSRVSGRRRSSGSAPAGSRSSCSSARIAGRRGERRDGRGALRAVASVRLHRARHRGVEQGDDARRPAGVLDAELRAEQRRAGRVGADHRWRSCGRWSRRRSATGQRGTPVAAGAGQADDDRRAARDRRQAGRAADAAARRRRSARRARRPTTRRCG